MAHKRKKNRFASERSRPHVNPIVKECVAFGALIFLLSLWQAAPNGWPTICGGRPLLLVALVASIAMFTTPTGGAAAGVAAGLLWDLYSTRLFGINALLLMLIGCTVSLLSRLLLRNNFLSALILTGGAIVSQTLLDWLLNQVLPNTSGAMLYLVHTALPNAVYTFVLALPIYALTRWVAGLLRP